MKKPNRRPSSGSRGRRPPPVTRPRGGRRDHAEEVPEPVTTGGRENRVRSILRRLPLYGSAALRALSGLRTRFAQIDVLMYASALAFSVLLTVIPLLILSASAVGMLLSSSDQAMLQLKTILDAAFPPQPYSSSIKDSILSIVTDLTAYHTTLGVISVVVLTVTATFLFDIVRTVLHRAYRLPRKRGMVIGFLRDVWFTLLTFSILISLNLIVWMLRVLEKMLDQYPRLHDLVASGPLSSLPVWTVILIATLLFYIVYRYVPDSMPPRSAALVSTITMTVLWLLSGELFSVYVTRFSAIGTIYGPYTFLLVLLLWIYYSCLIFVLGAIAGELFWERLKTLRATAEESAQHAES